MDVRKGRHELNLDDIALDANRIDALSSPSRIYSKLEKMMEGSPSLKSAQLEKKDKPNTTVYYLNCKLSEAKGFSNSNIDVFALATLSGQCFKTKTVCNTTNPLFVEDFEL